MMMQNIKIALEVECYNLDLTFKPSFISSTYRQVGKNTWRKIDSHLFKNFTIKQEKDAVFITGLASISKESMEEFIYAETGLWHEPFEYCIHKAPNEFKELLEKLSELYPGVRIPVSLFEQDKIFVAVCLSKRTDYETFVRYWMERILEKYDDILNIIYASRNDLKDIGTSYQIFDLINTMKSMLELCSNLDKLPIYIKKYLESKYPIEKPFVFISRVIPPQIARIVLISLVKGIGPKTADSYLLNTSFHTDIVPVDTHLKNVTKRLLLREESFKIPQSSLCSKYSCTEMFSRKLRIPLCPISSRCIRSKILELGDLAGWFQTLSYLFGRDYCRKNKPRCNICPLKKDCYYFNIFKDEQ